MKNWTCPDLLERKAKFSAERTVVLRSSAPPWRKTHFHVKRTFFLKNENLFHFLIFNFVSKMKIDFNFQFSILFRKWKFIIFQFLISYQKWKMISIFNFLSHDVWPLQRPWEAGLGEMLPMGESRRIPWEGERPNTPKIYQK